MARHAKTYHSQQHLVKPLLWISSLLGRFKSFQTRKYWLCKYTREPAKRAPSKVKFLVGTDKWYGANHFLLHDEVRHHNVYDFAQEVHLLFQVSASFKKQRRACREWRRGGILENSWRGANGPSALRVALEVNSCPMGQTDLYPKNHVDERIQLEKASQILVCLGSAGDIFFQRNWLRSARREKHAWLY